MKRTPITVKGAERLRAELKRLKSEDRPAVIKAIAEARGHGDLSENAEYHAAKDKQANMNKMVADLQLRLGRARFVEDAEFREGVVGLGTEVALTSEGGGVSYWILGDGEQHLGDNVISFQAPIGRALMGRAVGDEVAFGEGSKRVTWRVQTVTRRLP